MGAVAKTFDRIIPNEIKPIVPIAASMFGAPLLGTMLPGAASGIFASPIGQALRTGLIGAGTNVATQALMGQKIDPRSALLSGIFSGGGTYLKGIPARGLQAGPPTALKSNLYNISESAGQLMSPDLATATLGDVGMSASLAAGAGGTLAAMDAAEKANDEYNRMMEKQGMTEAADTQARKDYITKYMNLAGFNQEEIDSALSKYGYKKGGRVGYANGGSSLYDKASDMNRLALEIKLIDLGYGGFGGKDLETMTDEEIKKLYEEATSKANGGRIGYRIGGPVKTFIAKLLGAEPSDEVLNKMFEERKKEIFNSMFDPEKPQTSYSMKQMEEADAIATKKAMKELEEYKMSLGMNMDNPPEGTVGSSVIEQIMEPRKKGRVQEAKGGRIKKSIGGLAFAYKDYLRQADELGLSGDPMSFEEFTDTWLELQSDLGNSEKYKKGGRAGYAGGKMVKKQNTGRVSQLFQQIEDGVNVSEAMAELLNVYGIDLYDTKAEGGIMNLKMGGMPAEMDLRPGGFVPIGVKEKADDVPARLSKNEFVMTADAVRAAGGGSVNKGAQKMYDLMHSLEARV